ncbi:hypothetical protein MESS2_1010020 [Mesorhizobium metallidurans STM 2683]|uniref:Uncharacterized protein n=1 Tax=Mesorhizobium metallidurans STM 2683 TaxID=1297569 RepID=M5EEK4_9HYPH|nr:hypothetical protein MESS2_1010020 [Mesorhizobium metallidurans STM 2683]
MRPMALILAYPFNPNLIEFAFPRHIGEIDGRRKYAALVAAKRAKLFLEARQQIRALKNQISVSIMSNCCNEDNRSESRAGSSAECLTRKTLYFHLNAPILVGDRRAADHETCDDVMLVPWLVLRHGLILHLAATINSWEEATEHLC